MPWDSAGLFCGDLPTAPVPEHGTILVAGATGYVGGRLVPELLARGYTVRAMVRGDAAAYEKRWPAVEIVEGDALKAESMRGVFDGVHAAYYLIHSLLLGTKRFVAADIEAAANFRRAAERQHVGRIIYLGGLGDVRTTLSCHLQSRMQIAEELQRGVIPVTILRAAIIIGSGSASYEIVANLVRSLRVIPIPPWGRTSCQPIGIRDVIKYLVGVLELGETAGKVYDIGGPDVLTYEHILRTQADLVGKRIWFPRVPFASIRLYSYVASLSVPVPSPIIRSLLEGSRNEVICLNEDIRTVLPFSTVSLRESLVRALSREEQDRIHTRWSDAYPPAFELALKLRDMLGPPQYSTGYSILSEKNASTLFRSVCEIGGKKGWVHSTILWRLRGMIDRLLLGIGSHRGRRDHTRLQINDVVDFWRVEDLIPDELLLLRAEMKLPGKAWLEFGIEEHGIEAHDQVRRLSVRAYFYTTSLCGRIYWYVFHPFHVFLFRGLIRRIESRA
ncbi:SDR family oxidoreductase [Candidatus Fermentibacteria bacterium]|nr:SDR family oxidoreductase [Candidatus Fermentibacteria bacterium]